MLRIFKQMMEFYRSLLVSVLMVAILTVAIFALVDVVDLRHTISLFFIPVIIASLRGSFAEGIVAAIAGALSIAFFFYDPPLSFYVDSPREIANIVMFVVVAVTLNYLTAKLRRFKSTLEDATPKPPSLPRSKDDVGVIASANGISVPEKVTKFLIERPHQLHCDSCVQQSLQMKWRQQVQLVTGTLAATGLFKRESSQCSVCGEVKQVTRLQFSPSRLTS